MYWYSFIRSGTWPAPCLAVAMTCSKIITSVSTLSGPRARSLSFVAGSEGMYQNRGDALWHLSRYIGEHLSAKKEGLELENKRAGWASDNAWRDLPIRRWVGKVPGRIHKHAHIEVALRSCRASCDVSAQGNGWWDSDRGGLMYEADLYEFNTTCASPQYLCHKRCCGSAL